MTTIYFAGGEDCDHYPVGGAGVTTGGGTFRSAFARCALQCSGGVAYWQNTLAFSASTFWWTGRTQGSTGQGNALMLVRLVDSSNIVRLRVRAVGSGNNWAIEKINAAGTVTQLGVNTSWVMSGGVDKVDVFINYAVSGQITVYLNGIQVFTFSGDVTTDSVTTLASYQVFDWATVAVNWSEFIVSDTDTRNMSLQTLAPVANGNTHNFDTGTPAAANVNEITLSDLTLDGSTTAGQLDQYTIPAEAAGTFSILAIGVSARMQKGASGPTKMDLVLRSGTTDYLSSDQVLTLNWAAYQNWWTTDPNTSASWAAYPANVGLKSVT